MGDRAALWIRVSTMDQAEANQVPDILRWCEARGYEAGPRYELRGESAYRGEQDADQQRALDDMRAGHFSVLVAWAQDRVERRGMEATLRIRRLFREAGGRIEFTQEPWLNDGDDDLVLGITGWKDRQESKRKSERVRAANDEIDRAAGFRGGRPPWGYKSVGERREKRLVIDAAAAPVIRELFERTAAGQGVPTMIEWLQENHGIAKKATPVTAAIRKPLYWTGRYQVQAHNGTVAETRTAPIVSRDLWLAANAALEARPTTSARPRLPRKPDYSGRLFCGECGGKAYRMIGGDHGHRTRYYYCRSCKISWLGDRADEQVEALMLGDHTPELGTVIIPGTDHSGELERVLDELASLGRRNLPDAEHDRIQAGLRADRDRLREACANDEPPRREPGFTGRTNSQAWAAMGHAERCSYLVNDEFLVLLNGRGRSVSVERVWPELS